MYCGGEVPRIVREGSNRAADGVYAGLLKDATLELAKIRVKRTQSFCRVLSWPRISDGTCPFKGSPNHSQG